MTGGFQPGPRVSVIVAGMHRSGTSSLTRVLSACGYALPKTLLAASGSNERGFWESTPINRLNDKVLEAAGANWRSWRPLASNWLHVPEMQVLQAHALDILGSEFGDASATLIKDPRLSRLMPFWYPVLADHKSTPVVVCPLRNPLEVAASLEQRNGLLQPYSLLLWLRYQMDLERDTRGRARAFTHYEALLRDWRGVIDKIVAETGLRPPRVDTETALELSDWLSPRLRHHHAREEALLADSAMPEWVTAAYEIFLRWSLQGEDTSDFERLDRIRNEFDAIPQSLEGVLGAVFKLSEDGRWLRKKLKKQEAEQTELHRHFDTLGAQLQDAQARLAESSQRLALRDAEAQDLMQMVHAGEAQLQKSLSKIKETKRGRDTLNRKLESARCKVMLRDQELREIRSRPTWLLANNAQKILDALFFWRSSPRGYLPNQVKTVAASPHFDRGWYRSRYPDVAKSKVDPALHYVRNGACEGRDPGPSFSTRFYLEQNPDVARSGLNPLVHYELFGRRENRNMAPAQPGKPTRALGAGEQAGSIPEKHAAVSLSGPRPFFMPLPPPENQGAWLTQRDLAYLRQEPFISLGDMVLGRAPAAEGGVPDVPKSVVAGLEIFRRLNRVPEDSRPRLRRGELREDLGNGGAMTQELEEAGVHAFPGFPLALEAIWYAGDRELRIRFNADSLPPGLTRVVRGYQYKPGKTGGMLPVGEYRLTHASFQVADFALVNPYLPVLLTLSTADARMLDAALLPFPSLCPGGAHSAEVSADYSSGSVDPARMAKGLLEMCVSAFQGSGGRSLARVLVETRGADGTGRLFSAEFQEWLRNVFRIRTEPWKGDADDAHSEVRGRDSLMSVVPEGNLGMAETELEHSSPGADLVCPAEAFPSLHALVGGLSEGGLDRVCPGNPYVVIQRERHSLSMVEMPTGWNAASVSRLGERIRHPFIRRQNGGNPAHRACTGAPIALAERDTGILPPGGVNKSTIQANAPSTAEEHVSDLRPRIHVVFTAGGIDGQHFRTLLMTLQRQKGVELREILVAMPTTVDRQGLEVALEHYFGSRYRWLECAEGLGYADRAQRAADAAGACDYLLFVNGAVALHDPLTLDTLVHMAGRNNVAMASCALTETQETKAGPLVSAAFSGVLPTRQANTRDWYLAAFDAQALFPLDDYPVASPGDVLFMIKAERWMASGGFQAVAARDRLAALEFATLLAGNGLRHLITTRISAELLANSPEPDHLPWMPAETLAQSVLNSSACIQVLPS